MSLLPCCHGLSSRRCSELRSRRRRNCRDLEIVPITHYLNLLLFFLISTRSKQVGWEFRAVSPGTKCRNNNARRIVVTPSLASVRIRASELNVSHVHTSFSGTVENNNPVVASCFVLGSEIVGTIRDLDGKGALPGISFVDCNLSNLRRTRKQQCFV